jgi:hypothetical protein
VVDTEVFMVPKFRLDTTALVGRKVIWQVKQRKLAATKLSTTKYRNQIVKKGGHLHSGSV